MAADEAYLWLIEGAAPDADPFDAHVLASIWVARNRRAQSRALQALAETVFRGCATELSRFGRDDTSTTALVQTSLTELLLAHATGTPPVERPLAA